MADEGTNTSDIRLEVGGLVHDYNNILTIICAHLERVHMESSLSEQLRDRVAVMNAAALRGAGLSRLMVAWLRGDTAPKESIALNSVIDELLRTLEPTFPGNLTVSRNLDPDLPLMYGEPSQIYQSLLNVCINARDAMPNGGTLGVTSFVSPAEALASTFTPLQLQSEYVCIRIRDTGVGMNEEQLEKIFGTFFTTRIKHSGTGLGLAIVKRVMQSHGGHVDIHSVPNNGTEVRLFFPVHDPDNNKAGNEQRTS